MQDNEDRHPVGPDEGLAGLEHDRLIDTTEAAGILGIRPASLKKARVYGGPFAIPFVRLGRRVKYRTRDLAVHIRLNTFRSTSDALAG